MFANLFRRSYDMTTAHSRAATSDDLPSIARLLRDSERRYYNLNATDLPALLATAPGVLYENHQTTLAVALAGWQAHHATWLSCVVLARGLSPTTTVTTLLDALHPLLYERGLRQVFYAGDGAAETWLAPLLRQYGYVEDTTVVSYEKHTYDIPSLGNTTITVRQAILPDLPTLLDLDALCFEPHWTQSQSAMHAALNDDGYFIVAEDHGRVVGYAYASVHFQGRLVHVVRVAVHPEMQRTATGIRLLAELVRFAQTRRSEVITLNTQQYNTRAQRLYRWFGFAPGGDTQTILRYDLFTGTSRRSPTSL